VDALTRQDLFMSPEELAGILGEPEVRVVDTRFALDDDDRGEQEYEAGHIPGAIYLNWVRDLSDPDDSVAGQLAPPGLFRQTMEAAGIGDGTLVVAYDNGVIFTAARLAWSMHVYGHERVRVLDGGWPKWLAERRAIETGRVEPEAARAFTPATPRPLRATKADVLAEVESNGSVLLDCRMDETWFAAGAHIPGARRLPAPSLVNADGKLLPAAEIETMARQAGAAPDASVLLYCGGGVSASMGYVALRTAGYRNLRVYDGSWSEWSLDPGAPQETH
jgi:thiosulfate/3-mercaptopyruvate sulfurtransferase